MAFKGDEIITLVIEEKEKTKSIKSFIEGCGLCLPSKIWFNDIEEKIQCIDKNKNLFINIIDFAEKFRNKDGILYRIILDNKKEITVDSNHKHIVEINKKIKNINTMSLIKELEKGSTILFPTWYRNNIKYVNLKEIKTEKQKYPENIIFKLEPNKKQLLIANSIITYGNK